MSELAQQKQVMRKRLRQMRREVSAELRQQAAQCLVAQVQTLSAYQIASNIACYLDFDGEMATGPLVEQIIKDKGCCWLPKIEQLKPPKMHFLPLTGMHELSVNKLGIAEVDAPNTAAIAASKLELVFVPLVAVDATGHRLGMGGGFYDSFFRKACSQLIGIGFDFQMQSQLPVDDWDVPLAAFVSERQVCLF